MVHFFFWGGGGFSRDDQKILIFQIIPGKGVPHGNVCFKGGTTMFFKNSNARSFRIIHPSWKKIPCFHGGTWMIRLRPKMFFGEKFQNPIFTTLNIFAEKNFGKKQLEKKNLEKKNILQIFFSLFSRKIFFVFESNKKSLKVPAKPTNLFHLVKFWNLRPPRTEISVTPPPPEKKTKISFFQY